MDINKISENLDDFNIDELKLSEDNLSEIEIQAMKKNIKSKIKKPRKKGRIVAASAAIVITGTMFTPAVAKNLPFISDIYKKLGFFDGYEKYTKYIGESKTDNGYKVTIDNISTNGGNILVAIKIESQEVINKKNFIKCFADTSGIAKSENGSSTSNVSYADDKTVVIINNINLSVLDEVLTDGIIRLDIAMIDESSTENLMNVFFDLKVDLKEPLSNLKAINVGKKLNDDIYVESLKGTIKGANLKVEDKAMVVGEEDVLGDWIYHYYYLNVDGVIHKVDINSSSGYENGIGSVHFPYLTAEQIDKATSIELTAVEVNRIRGRVDLVEIINSKKDNIVYFSDIKTKSGLEGGSYKIEVDNNKVKLYFKSGFEALGLLENITLWESDKEIGDAKGNIGLIKKDGDNYILEFDNVNLERDIEITARVANLDLDNAKIIGTMKIK